MNFYKGFLVLGVFCLIIAMICIGLYEFLKQKQYFQDINDKDINTKLFHIIKLGCILIFNTSITFLFLPIVLRYSPFFEQTCDCFLDGIKNDIISKTKDSFYEDAENSITNIINSIMANEEISSFQIENIEQTKEIVIKYAIKYSKNRTLKDSIENACKLFKVEKDKKELFENKIKELTAYECKKVVENYSKNIKKTYVQNSLLKPWIEPIVKNTSMESFTGFPSSEKSIRIFEKAKNAFINCFLILSLLVFLFTTIIIFLIFFLIRIRNNDKINKHIRKHIIENKFDEQ